MKKLVFGFLALTLSAAAHAHPIVCKNFGDTPTKKLNINLLPTVKYNVVLTTNTGAGNSLVFLELTNISKTSGGLSTSYLMHLKDLSGNAAIVQLVKSQIFTRTVEPITRISAKLTYQGQLTAFTCNESVQQ